MSIPVLMYHHINNHSGDLVTVTPHTFDGQMRFLHKQGFQTLTLDLLLSYIRGQYDIPKKSVVITFDDGYLDNYIYAFPVLKKYGLNASIFLAVSWIEKASVIKTRSTDLINIEIPKHGITKKLIVSGDAHKAVLNWGLIKDMYESGLVDFFSHTMTHKKCDELVEDTELKGELKKSKEIIQEKLNKPCSYLCWPNGHYTKHTVDMARQVGYKALFTTKPGVVGKRTDPFYIERIVVKDAVGWFRNRMRIYTNPMLSTSYLRLKGKL